MLSAVVVPVEPFGQVFEKLSSGLVGSQVDPFILKCTPEPFNEDVVLEPAFTVHADSDVPLLQHRGECLAGKLAPLVAVEYLGGSVFEQCL